MTKKAVQLMYPENPLTALLLRDHGRPRAEALLGGAVRLEGQRGAAMAALEELIAGLERCDLRPSDLSAMTRDADRIVTLAATFGLTPLANAARRLCDIAALFAAKGGFDAQALDIHVRALRLFAPGSPILGDAEAATVLGRIAALATHLSRR